MILVFGQTGQVARELQRAMPGACYLSRSEADLADPAACARVISSAKPAAVINAAAYTAVDQAEEETGIAAIVNGKSPGAMAAACSDLGIPLVHISSDYVFDGSGDEPFRTNMETKPLGAYGKTKLAGEEAIRASGATHVILRTSWVFSAHGSNFVKSMLRLAETRAALNVVNDQIGGPTPASGIAAACMGIAEQLQREPSLSGTHHYSGAPDVSWADFAREIFAIAGKSVSVIGIPSSEYPTAAKRPANSRLDNTGLEKFNIERPDWRAALASVISELEHSV